jgi:3'-phosphoadenosine 5'-phosphosulfate sulfotransferase (PAPS reductase)/FAD synthetase
MTQPRLTIPDGHAESVFIVSVSGGKDSTATLLAMREAGIPHRAVFADTGWEAPETYEYLTTLERLLGITIDRVGVPGGMRAKIRARAGFPARMQRWCTRELKVEPLREYHDRIAAETGRDTVSVVGIRAEESEARAAMPVFGFDDRWGGYVWRPMLAATVAEVLTMHHRHGVPVNPLYQRGHSRVGCWPCIYASKDQIRLWARDDPAGVAEVAQMERDAEVTRAIRNAETPGRYAHGFASFFQSREVSNDSTGKRVYLPMHVEKVVEWAQTDRGGRQLLLVREEPDSGCFRWGMCEPPTKEEDDE